jgi:cyclopropane fatty-acyl-phospholipid synthase-like methyltransferase
MECCSSGSRYLAAERQFGAEVAARDLARYRRKGLDAASRMFLAMLGDQFRHGDSLLDIGAGVGILDFELLSMGASGATLVDASPAYLDAASREAQQLHMADRMQFVTGDFTALAGTIEPADVVTMHRVVCCYADYASLLETAATHARRLLAFSFPRNRWDIRGWLAIDNGRRRVLGNGFRVYVHPPAAMERLMRDEGFRRVGRGMTFVWSIDVYARS